MKKDRLNTKNINDDTSNPYDPSDPQSIFKLLDAYEFNQHLYWNRKIENLKKVGKKLLDFQKNIKESGKKDQDSVDKLVVLNKLIKKELQNSYKIAKSKNATIDDVFVLSFWQNMNTNLKNFIERFYWQDENKKFIRINDSVYNASLIFLNWNKIVEKQIPINITKNANDRSVRLTYNLNSLFPNGEVLMAKDIHGVDAVVCYKNAKGEIIDEDKNVIPNNKIDSYVLKCLKEKKGLFKLNTEYKTMTIPSMMSENILNGLIWFSNIKAEKDIPLMDCFVYSISSKYNDNIRLTFVIKNNEDMIWFNELLDLIRNLYHNLYKYGGFFTKDELGYPSENKFNKSNNDLDLKNDSLLKLVSDFDCTDMHVWMLYKCKVFFEEKVVDNKIRWHKKELLLRDAIGYKFQYYKLPESMRLLDEDVKSMFDAYINDYEFKIQTARTYLMGRSITLFENNLKEKAEFDIRINNYIQTLTDTLTKLKNHLIKTNPELEQTNDYKITK